ncbi:MAG: dihydroorotate dehydrogenase [Actinomycetes bacterium]
MARPAVDAEVRLGRLVLPNPIVAASGTFGHGAELARLCPPAELGAITVKSLAAMPWAGNPAPRLHPATAGMLNSVGLQGPGVAAWIAEDLPGLRAAGARVIASVWGRNVGEFGDAARLLAPAVADLVAVEVNVSCPNLEDRSRIFAHSEEATRQVVDAVVAADLGVPVFAKLSPNTDELPEIAAAAVEAGAEGLTLVNTLLGYAIDIETRRPVLGAGRGGLSGAAIKPVALRAVHDVTQAVPGVPVIGTGGISNGRDAVEMMLAGASAVGVGTATFRDPRAPRRILGEVLDWCAAHGVGRVRDLTGAVEDR